MSPMFSLALAAALLAEVAVGAGEAEAADTGTANPPLMPAAAESIVDSLRDPDLRQLVAEVLARNPQLAALAARARAADQRAPQVRSLPDPMASLTYFLATPETRVGPQQAAASVSQRLPWFGTLRLRERAALLDAAAAHAAVEAKRLALVTVTRKLSYELAFLDEQARVVGEDRTTLQHYDELAQARYASGVGLAQAVVKIQAEITRAEARLLDIDERRAAVVAELNVLRDRPGLEPVSVSGIPAAAPLTASFEGLSAQARARRPELLGASLEVESSSVRVELAKKGSAPDVTVGLTYTLVGPREDAAGRLNPPEGNGDDILGLSGGVNLPVWRDRVRAGVEEAVQSRLAAEERHRAVAAEIDGRLGDLSARLPLLYDQLRLYDDVLSAQAEQSLLSAEAAYATGTVSALDLLDAERVLFDVRIAAERVRADHAIAVAQIEGEVGAPLGAVSEDDQS